MFIKNPTIVIDLSQLGDYSDILSIMSKHRIENYVYEFIMASETIKFGYSADKQRHYGERIYRQSGNLEGWSKRKLQGGNGMDMRIIDEDYFSKYGIRLNRNHMQIAVVNMTGHSKVDCENLERSLIDSYIQNNHGQAPIGNKDPVTKLVERRYNNDRVMKRLFHDFVA